MKNLNDKRIYSYIINQISTNPLLYTRVTNTQIANDLKISVFTVRDKVLKLVKQGYLNSYVDYFDEQNNYVQRKITKGSLEPSIC
jgi:predicted DNA-binding transcriptional regulator